MRKAPSPLNKTVRVRFKLKETESSTSQPNTGKQSSLNMFYLVTSSCNAPLANHNNIGLLLTSSLLLTKHPFFSCFYLPLDKNVATAVSFWPVLVNEKKWKNRRFCWIRLLIWCHVMHSLNIVVLNTKSFFFFWQLLSLKPHSYYQVRRKGYLAEIYLYSLIILPSFISPSFYITSVFLAAVLGA